MEMEQAARLAHLERTKAEVATIIATVAAAQKAVEERALMEAAAAAEELTKEEECNAERGRRRKERSEGERGEKGDHDWEDNREKCLLKFVDAVVVKTMSKHPTQMDVDTFKKHAKELTHHCGEEEVGLQGQSLMRKSQRSKSSRGSTTTSTQT
ncbi:hypothetical protein DFH94DRAFT_406103 [Russula ochroleuca]|uniref:Set2 Rpb1 interacting domain-containing protein n=1 Tax=Russula ochroleuca TaxID=152965 RepID=A0A9P5MY97_9AGAM|nr:hypothetical protein DFH94DRAFT_406103 [Russula ochroleuca]